MFTVIPVIDLLGGQVVYAQRGDRANYQPIESPLCQDSSPISVISGLRSVYRFPIVYIADLGAIQQGENHLESVNELINAFPDVLWWVDAGFTDPSSVEPWQHPAIRPVLGTESITDLSLLQAGSSAQVLSLDSKSGASFDPLRIGGQPAAWPDNIIVMTLDKVGSNSGPDFSRLAQIQQEKPGAHVYAAGGVRGLEDLKQLAAQGVAGALIATAIHNGSLGSADLTELANQQARK